LAAKPVQFRDLATVDLDSAADSHVVNADLDVAVRFVDAVEVTARRMGKNPGLGFLRFAYELAIPGLRAMTVGRFSSGLFYVERDDAVDVWRLLHTSRDISTTLQESND
jgi:toxin ParE1/3/4